MVNPPRSITDTELEVLKALWTHGSGTVRELHDAVGGDRRWAYTTLLTLLRRLQDKGYVEARKQGRAHVFEAIVEQQDLLDEHLTSLAERVCEGERLPLMLSLFEGGQFTRDQIDDFRRLLDDLETGKRKRTDGDKR